MSGSSSPLPSSSSFSPSEMLLPPNWTRRESARGEVVYVNEISGEQSTEHPFQRFLRMQGLEGGLAHTTHTIAPEEEGTTKGTTVAPAENSGNSGDRVPMVSDEGLRLCSAEGGRVCTEVSKEVSKEVCEYHCQWTERDVHGDVSMYGLTIRMHGDGRALVRFDGIDAAWSFASLEGLYGPLGPHDLFVGAKVSVFGRHFTISAVNAHAARFIAREKRRLEAQQEQFRRRIESVGATPCVKRRGREGVQDISRGARLDEQTNLRALLKENARLGEQLAQLGLAYKL